MEALPQDARDIEPAKRRSLETVLGHTLRDDQRVLIRVVTVGPEPDAATKAAAFDRISSLSAKVAKHRESLGISDEEADRIVDEACAHVRYGTS